jgi:prolyl oligopeptidase
VSVSGSDWTDWHFRELASGKDLPDVIRFTKYYAPVFSQDDRGVYYSAFPAPAAGTELAAQDSGDAVFYHALGTPETADQRLLAKSDHGIGERLPHRSQCANARRDAERVVPIRSRDRA